MDALARLAPVCRPLIGLVDDTLATLGAPAEHPIWGLLRCVRATPGQVLAGIELLAPAGLHERASSFALRASRLRQISLPASVEWQGSAGAAFAARLTALGRHLDADADSLAERAMATGEFLRAVADWQVQARDLTAHALAEVMGSVEAVALRSPRALGPATVGPIGDPVAGRPRLEAIRAAAEIGAHVLRVAQTALDAGYELLSRRAQLTQLPDPAELRAVGAPAASTISIGG